VVPEFSLEAPKTRALVGKLRELGLSDALILTEQLDEPLLRAARNLKNVDVLSASEVDPVSMVAFETVLATEGAIKKLEERLA
jgi:large subunit ribosomal protein L4